jgi:hypothetical protein
MDFKGRLHLTLKNEGNEVTFVCINAYTDETSKPVGSGVGLSRSMSLIELIDSEASQYIEKEFNTFKVTLKLSIS